MSECKISDDVLIAAESSKWDVLAQSGPVILLQTKSGNRVPFQACARCFIEFNGQSTGIMVDGSYCSSCGLVVKKINLDEVEADARRRK